MGLLGKLIRLARRVPGDDAGLLALVRRDPAAGWRLFLDRYSGQVLAFILDVGFDHDEAMDRFVYVCEKLAENECRRLRDVQHLGERGELVPWLRQVVRNLLINWAWSQDGRLRLMKSIEGLGSFEQQVFRLHFWEGLTASEVLQLLLAEGRDARLIEVYAALDAIHGALSAAKRWRLVSRLQSRERPFSLDGSESGPWAAVPACEPDPEHVLLAAETEHRLHLAIEGLPARERLVLGLRYDEWLETKEIAELLGESPEVIRRCLRGALTSLRSEMENERPQPARRELSPRSQTA